MKLKIASEDYDSLRRQSEALLQEKDAELKSIKDLMAATKQQVRLYNALNTLGIQSLTCRNEVVHCYTLILTV